MPLSDTLRLTLLAAIWGASFLFMRVAAPEFGPVPLILIRVCLGGLLLLPLCRSREDRALMRKHGVVLFLMGLLSSALPFCLLAYATLTLEAGFTSLLNATTPMFTAIIGALCFGTALRTIQVLGLVVAFAGVAILSGAHFSFGEGGAGLAILAVFGATTAYGFAANYSKRHLTHLPAHVVSAGTLIGSTAVLVVPGVLLWPDGSAAPSLVAWLSAIGLAALCTSLAFLIFFKILIRTGAMAATTVTFLVPVFGVLWGCLLLGESLTVRLMMGMVVILFGTALAIGLVPFKGSAKAAGD